MAVYIAVEDLLYVFLGIVSTKWITEKKKIIAVTQYKIKEKSSNKKLNISQIYPFYLLK